MASTTRKGSAHGTKVRKPVIPALCSRFNVVNVRASEAITFRTAMLLPAPDDLSVPLVDVLYQIPKRFVLGLPMSLHGHLLASAVADRRGVPALVEARRCLVTHDALGSPHCEHAALFFPSTLMTVALATCEA
jgi:hypothetical protein